MNLTQKFAYNTIFSATAYIVKCVIAVVIISLISGYLKESGFGDYVVATSFVYIFSVIADLGLYSIVVREISRKGADEEKIINNAFSIRITAGFFILSSAFFVSLIFPYSFEVKKAIGITAAGFWILSNTQVLIGLFQKHMAMDRIAIAETASRIVQLLFLWIFITLDYGFLFIMSTIFFGAATDFAIVYYFTKKYIRLKLSFEFSFWKKILSQSFPLAISAILVLIYFKLDTIFLSVMKTSKDVGIYGMSYKIMENFIFFPSMIVGLAMPIMSRCVFFDKARFRIIAQKVFNLLIIIFVPLIVGSVFVSDKIIFLIAGRGFYDSPIVLNILMIALGFIFLGSFFSNIIISANMQKFLAWIYFIGTIFNIAANIIFIPSYSYFGAASTTVATEFLVTALMILVTYKKIGFIPSFEIFRKATLSSAIMAAALFYFNYLNIFYLVFIGIVVYSLAIYFLGGISKDEIKKLANKDF